MVNSTTLNSYREITTLDGRMTPHMSAWANIISTAVPLFGEGSPEAVVVATQGRFYFDTLGASGSVLYVKRDTDIAGDASKGWVLV